MARWPARFNGPGCMRLSGRVEETTAKGAVVRLLGSPSPESETVKRNLYELSDVRAMCSEEWGQKRPEHGLCALPACLNST